MSPNSDNAMARFLFAILKQKNLKDVSLPRKTQAERLRSVLTIRLHSD
jgi:hypothetical protein